ncbi:nuclear transport factor 2 family protein [Nocardia arthritidis]|uniref:Polyketide cyclase n=1 Tax=Nocardia arthritidis TaxID=228602 RepID=A0A6G9YB56_9NOCA|nr:nuclear transport factor 2 family protein [Nocardia arthritidis]QIS10451.1 polyketide cyclase [Nocardia arthritidis]
MTYPNDTTQDSVDSAWVMEFSRRFLAAWNDHDPDQVLDLLTTDVVYDDDSWPTVMHGHGEVRVWLETLWHNLPDLEFEVLGVYPMPEQPRAAVHWRFRCTMTGHFDSPDSPATDKHCELEGTDIYKFRDGRACSVRTIMNIADLNRQLDIPSPSASAANASPN